MSEQPEPFNVDMLYLEAEHFALIAESRPPLEPGKRVVSIGRPFQGLMPREDGAGPVRPGEEPT
ncbi:hypothetical protein [Streptomyces sp. NPDC001492]